MSAGYEMGIRLLFEEFLSSGGHHHYHPIGSGHLFFINLRFLTSLLALLRHDVCAISLPLSKHRSTVESLES